MILETLTAGLLALLGYMIKENTKSQRQIAQSVEHLANNIAYCPLNKKNKKIIKN